MTKIKTLFIGVRKIVRHMSVWQCRRYIYGYILFLPLKEMSLPLCFSIYNLLFKLWVHFLVGFILPITPHIDNKKTLLSHLFFVANWKISKCVLKDICIKNRKYKVISLSSGNFDIILIISKHAISRIEIIKQSLASLEQNIWLVY